MEGVRADGRFVSSQHYSQRAQWLRAGGLCALWPRLGTCHLDRLRNVRP